MSTTVWTCGSKLFVDIPGGTVVMRPDKHPQLQVGGVSMAMLSRCNMLAADVSGSQQVG